eukprot:gene29218-35270_t
MSTRSSVEARKRQKMREIQRRIPYMRASSPPSKLFRCTTRAALEAQNKELRPVPNIIDQLLQKGILQDEYYNHLKSTLHSSKEGGGDSPNNSSSQRLQLAGAQAMSPTIKSPSSPPSQPNPQPNLRILTTPTSNPSNSTASPTTHFSHPLVATLAERDLTPLAKLRKIQAKIRVDVEEKMFGSSSSK